MQIDPNDTTVMWAAAGLVVLAVVAVGLGFPREKGWRETLDDVGKAVGFRSERDLRAGRPKEGRERIG